MTGSATFGADAAVEPRPGQPGLPDAPGERRTDRGSGVVLVLGLVSVAAGLALFVTALGAAALARHRAESVADLAALAAAAARPGPDCTRASAVAVGSRAVVLSCVTEVDGSVVVTAGVDLPAWLASWTGGRPATARARAGHPASPARPPSAGASGPGRVLRRPVGGAPPVGWACSAGPWRGLRRSVAPARRSGPRAPPGTGAVAPAAAGPHHACGDRR